MSNLCLLNTSGIRAAAENAQRIISDKDVGGSTQQQVFREKNLLLNSVHGRTLFNKPAINLCSCLVSAASIFKKLTERAPDASYIFKSGTIPAIRIAAPGLFGANFYRRAPVNQAVLDTEKFYAALFGIPP